MEKTKINWEYGSFYKKYNMSGKIKIGTGEIQVHDIFETLPDFMKKSDIIFSDPPCSKGNINSFYTKADKNKYHQSFEPFQKRFFECIDEINPKQIFIEVFKSNYDYFLEQLRQRYRYVNVYNSMYYFNPKNNCCILNGTNKNHVYPIHEIDESKIIEWICKNIDFECIGDLCMGMGLVGFYANKYNKKFVGTELNEKRLAVLMERINTGKL